MLFVPGVLYRSMLEAFIVACQPVLQHLVRIFWPDNIDCAVHDAFKLRKPQLRRARSRKIRNLDDRSISLVNITRKEDPGPDDVNTETYSMRTFHRHRKPPGGYPRAGNLGDKISSRITS